MQKGRLNKALDRYRDFEDYGITTYRDLINDGIFYDKKISQGTINDRYAATLDEDEYEIYRKKQNAKKEYSLLLTKEKGVYINVAKIIYDAFVPIKDENTAKQEPELQKDYKKE